jgi:hypothetical protein
MHEFTFHGMVSRWIGGSRCIMMDMVDLYNWG